MADELALATPVGPAAVPRPREHAEAGVSYRLPFVNPYRNLWEVSPYDDDELTTAKLVSMRRTDGQARALHRLITLPILAALKTAKFLSETQVEGGTDEAKFAEQLLTLPVEAGGMKTPLLRVLSSLLLAVFDGFAGAELVYQVPETGPLAGKITLEKIATRPSETLTFLVNDKLEFAGFRQRVQSRNEYVDKYISGDTAIYFACNESERPFRGVSYFQAAWYHWDKKVKLYFIAHLAAQRAAVGTRVGTLPPSPSPEEKAKFNSALADLGVAQYIAVPEGYKVESLKEGGQFDFLGLINHHNSQMSKSVLAPWFDDNQGGDGVLVDFGRQSDTMFMLMLDLLISELELVFNSTIIPRFIDWNFGSGKYPTFRLGPLSKEQKIAIKETFDKLATAGQQLRATPEFVFELEKQLADEYGLEIDYETVERRMKEEQEQAAKIAEQAARQAAAGAVQAPPQRQPGGPQPGRQQRTVRVPVQGQPARSRTAPLSAEPILTLSELAAELLADAYDELGGGPG